VGERHVGLVGAVQLELEVSEHAREGEVELCVAQAVLVCWSAQNVVESEDIQCGLT
jgi:hypothetical protein